MTVPTVNVWNASCETCSKPILVVQEWVPCGYGIRHATCPAVDRPFFGDDELDGEAF